MSLDWEVLFVHLHPVPPNIYVNKFCKIGLLSNLVERVVHVLVYVFRLVYLVYMSVYVRERERESCELCSLTPL